MLVPSESKTACLLFLLGHVIPAQARTLVFVASRHAAEHTSLALSLAGYTSTVAYGALDPTARTENVARFRSGEAQVRVRLCVRVYVRGGG
jgi:superfamily II DNA/RNA helicase